MASPKRKALGKGLSALLNETGDVESAKDQNADLLIGNIAEIEIEKIEPNPNQPRSQFDKEALEELAMSVKELGIIQPITVRKVEDDRFQIISGERRYRAAKEAGLESIPCYIRLADDQNMLEMALVENIQREELDSIEIALSYQRLIDECDLTQEGMSERVGKKRSTITNYLRLLKLQPLIQAGLRDKMISMGHARALINITDEEEQLDVYQTAIEKDWSVRQVEDAVRKLRERKESGDKPSPAKPPLPEEHEEKRQQLAQKLDSNVNLTRNNKGKGKISINFDNDAEFERIIELLNS